MTLTLNKELTDALSNHPERVVVVEDRITSRAYVVMTREEFQRLVYDDSDLTAAEMLAAGRIAVELDADADPLSP